MLAEVSPRVLLYLAKELQRDAVANAQEGLKVPSLAAAVWRAQQAVEGGEEPSVRGPAKGAPLRSHIPLEEVWSHLTFLLHGRLHQLCPEELCFFLEVLADVGPLAFRHAHRSLTNEEPSRDPGVATSSTVEDSLAPIKSTGPQKGALQAAPALRIRDGALAGVVQWRPDIVTEVEDLLVSQADDVSLKAAVAAVNCPQLLLYPFLLLPKHLVSPRGKGAARDYFFVELLHPLLEPLGVLASRSSAGAKVSARHQIIATLGDAVPAGAPSEASVASSLVGLWHAALSLDLHFPLLSAATLREAEHNFPLLPPSCKLLPSAASLSRCARSCSSLVCRESRALRCICRRSGAQGSSWGAPARPP